MVYDKMIKWCERRKRKQLEKQKKKDSKNKEKTQSQNATKKEIWDLKDLYEKAIMNLQEQIDDIYSEYIHSTAKVKQYKKCKVPGCDNKVSRAGKCQRHYGEKGKKKCIIPGCELYAQNYSDYCSAHFDRKKRWGDPFFKLSSGGVRLCTIVHCRNIHYAGGYCKEHLPTESDNIESGNPFVDIAGHSERMQEARKAEMVR